MESFRLFNVGAEIVQLLQDMSRDEICAFAELHEDPQDDAQIELFIFICFFIFLKIRLRDYLDRAVQRAEGWLAVAPDDQPERIRRSRILDTILAIQFQMLAELCPNVVGDHELTKRHCRQEIDTVNDGQFQRQQSINELNEAVEAADDAIKATTRDNQDRADCLNNLGNRLGRRFERTGDMADLESSLASYKQGWACRTAPPSIRIRLARYAASILALQSKWEESSNYLNNAVLLLPTVSTRLLQHTDKQHMLQDFAGLASAAAATTLNTGKEAHKALELLELGRGVIAGLLLDLRTDISDLRLQYPTLADEFASLRNELDSPTERIVLLTPDHDTYSQELQARRRREANQRFEELIGEIRSQPGF